MFSSQQVVPEIKCWNYQAFNFVKNSFKACVRYFISIFYFSPNDSSSKTLKKCFSFHLKSFCRSRNIHIFVFSSSTFFSPVSYCFTSWPKKNPKVYDVIICLNKNLITSSGWYLEKGKRCGIETLSIDRKLNKEHFYEKIMQKMCTKS